MISGSYAPSEIEINSLAIGLLHHSNLANLDLTEKEYLVVGERSSTTTDTRDIKYGLIVNNDIVAINTSRRRIDGIENDAVQSGSLYVGNNIICDGNIIAKGLQFSGVTVNGDVSETLTSVLNKLDNIIPLVNKGYTTIKDSSLGLRVDNIYSTSFLTLGGKIDTFKNTNPLNIVNSANYNVNNAHISLGNDINNSTGESSKMRIGIVGDTAYSPGVITTTSGMPLHFHVGMTTQEVNKLYSQKTGYPNYTSNILPSLVLDVSGNVGFGITESTTLKYNKYIKVSDNITIQKQISNKAKVQIKGGAYIDDIITYDYYTQSNLHIDDIYVRKTGLNFNAEQVIPGKFTKGVFEFKDDVLIGDNENKSALFVNNYLDVIGDIKVENNSYLNNLNVSGDTVFDNDVDFLKNARFQEAEINGNINITGNLKIDDVRINITELSPVLIDKDIAKASNIDGSNILFFASKDVINLTSGSNLVIPGRMGVGVIDTDNYNEKMNIIKRDANQFELLLQDSSTSNNLLTDELNSNIAKAYIGHINTLSKYNNIADKSLIINTNDIDDAFHNIYFYPGKTLNRRNMDTSIPTLTISQSNMVGINTKSPLFPLQVDGTVCVDDIFVRRNTDNYEEAVKTLPFIQKKSNSYIGNVSEDFYYLYDVNNANKFNINFANDDSISLKGLNVKGGIHSTDGGYYENNVKLATFKLTDIDEKFAYSTTHLSVGIDNEKLSTNPLLIRNTYDTDYNDSIIRLYRGVRYGAINRNSIFTGIDMCSYEQFGNVDRNKYKWYMYRNHQITDIDSDLIDSLQFGYTDGSYHPTHSGINMYFNNNTSNYHIDINSKIFDSEYKNKTSAMSIYGDLDVHGNINLIGSSNSYKINGINVSPTAIDEISQQIIDNTELLSNNNNKNDVVITGNKIAILPEKTLAVGNISDGFTSYIYNIGKADTSYNIPLTVFQNSVAPTCSFVTNCNDQNQQRLSSIELSIVDTTMPQQNDIKKNSVRFDVSDFNSDINGSFNTKFQLGSYNKDNYNVGYYKKMFAIYDNDFTNYFHIGKTPCENANKTLKIEDINNLSLHVENSSKYLLQLTNNALPPALNLHKSGQTNCFWTIKGPNRDKSLIINYNENGNSYLPSGNESKPSMTITPDSIGINKRNPIYTTDILSKTDTSSMSLTNLYADYITNVVNTILPVKSEHFTYLYHSNLDNNTFTSTFDYIIQNKDIPINDYIQNKDISYDVYDFNTHEIAVNSIKQINEDYHLYNHIDHFIDITSNNNNITYYFEHYNQSYDDTMHSNNIYLRSVTHLSHDLPVINGPISLVIDGTYNDLYSNEVLLEVYDELYKNKFHILNNILFAGNSLVSSNIEIKQHSKDQNNILHTDILFETRFAEENECDKHFMNIAVNLLNVVNDCFPETTSNIITTSNIVYYKYSHEFDVHVSAYVDKLIHLNTKIKTPTSVLSNNIHREIDISSVENYQHYDADVENYQIFYDYNQQSFYKSSDIITKTLTIKSKIHFLNPTGDHFQSVRTGTVSISSADLQEYNVFNDKIRLNITYTDEFEIFENNIENIDKFTKLDIDVYFNLIDETTIKKKPHIILQNSLQYTNNDGYNTYGNACKLYNDNGSLLITTENKIYENAIVNIQKEGNVTFYGDINVNGNIFASTANNGLMEVNDIKLWGDIFDRLGNSLTFNYNEDMYHRAFVMQSSNYILYTSNYDIHSTSNITFTIQGYENDSGFKIVKEDVNTDLQYDLFTIQENENNVFTVKSGGHIGINTDVDDIYDLSINYGLKTSNIISSNIFTKTIHSDSVKVKDLIVNDGYILTTGPFVDITFKNILKINSEQHQILEILPTGHIGINAPPDNDYDVNILNNIRTGGLDTDNINLYGNFTLHSGYIGINKEPCMEYDLDVNDIIRSRRIQTSNVGINKTPDIGFDLDVNDIIRSKRVKIQNKFTTTDAYNTFAIQTTGPNNITCNVLVVNERGHIGLNCLPDEEPDFQFLSKFSSKFYNNVSMSNLIVQNLTISGSIVFDTTETVNQNGIVQENIAGIHIDATADTESFTITKSSALNNINYINISNLVNNKSIFTIPNSGYVCIGNIIDPDIHTTDLIGGSYNSYQLYVLSENGSEANSGSIYVENRVRANEFIGIGSNITNINLADKTSDDLQEGLLNIYYTTQRQTNISNYVELASNMNYHYFSNLDHNMSNYIQNLDFGSETITNDQVITSNLKCSSIQTSNIQSSNIQLVQYDNHENFIQLKYSDNNLVYDVYQGGTFIETRQNNGDIWCNYSINILSANIKNGLITGLQNLQTLYDIKSFPYKKDINSSSICKFLNINILWSNILIYSMKIILRYNPDNTYNTNNTNYILFYSFYSSSTISIGQYGSPGTYYTGANSLMHISFAFENNLIKFLFIKYSNGDEKVQVIYNNDLISPPAINTIPFTVKILST